MLHALQDKFPDPTLLDISDVELHDLLLFEEDPTIVVKFSCQQISCWRDRFGNVVDGSPDSVHRVLYVWALRQVSPLLAALFALVHFVRLVYVRNRTHLMGLLPCGSVQCLGDA